MYYLPNLKEARKAKGLTQKEVCEKLQMKQSQYSRYESGEDEMKIGTLIEIKQRNAEERDKEGDWSCIYCKNLNYSFRSVCNRCKIPKIPIIYNSNLLMNPLNFSMMQSPCFFSINNGKK